MTNNKEHYSSRPLPTAWYIVDNDDNVGIMEFGENGPIPWGTEEACIEDLVFGYEEKGKYQRINLTDDQIYNLMEAPHQPKDEKLWINVAVKIDFNQGKDFLELTRNPDVECHTISTKLGLYVFDALDCLSDYGDSTGKLLETSTLYRMLDKEMILEVYKRKDFFIKDVWMNDKVEFEHDFTSAPYFIYVQPYWPELPAERINIPANPIKLNQFPEEFRERIYHLPVKFRECKSFQISQWIPSYCKPNTDHH